METKHILIGLMLFYTAVVQGQFEETQIKFQWSEIESPGHLKKQLDGLNGFQFEVGESYHYFDIYLDTPDELLFNSGFSLRLRKRIKSDFIPTYVMQLKSEAGGTKSTRVEVEEKELDFYRVLNSDNEVVYLPEILDSVFNSIEKSQDVSNQFELLEKWLSNSVNASITPFQYLYHFNRTVFTPDKLASLEVRMIGSSKRQRGYICIQEDQFSGPLILPRSKDDTPLFFQENQDLVWLMETSLDSSVFYRVGSNQQATIRELEIELKYEGNQWGFEALEAYHEEVKKQMGLKEIRASKYRQAINSMY